MTEFLLLHSFRLLTWLITILVIFNFPISSSSNLQSNDNCEHYFNCGNLTNVGFPFWGGSSRPESCGYPGFELSCENNVTTVLETNGMKYHVLNINSSTQILRMAREDFVGGICLQKFVNTTLDFELFSYALGTQNITVLYGCQAPKSSTPGQFRCKYNGVETDGYPELGALGPNGCNASVIVPILESSAVQIGLSLIQVIDKGFEVSYKAALCTECVASNGRCGYDIIKNKATCVCADGSIQNTSCGSSAASGYTPRMRYRIAGITLGSAIGIGMLILLVCYSKWRSLPANQDIEAFLKKYGSLAPKRYTYRSLKKMTNSFLEKLGEGGYGTVYKGKLPNGHMVAVKLLKKSKDNAEEFINEVTGIGRTNHVNIVTLLGFCIEGRKRALIYDFMPNGSLEKFIYGRNDYQSLGWQKLFQIAVGIARGLEYLHRGCNTRIVHFDIKPHNILLDENFCPKISDFGLAKSCVEKDSIISMSGARGAVGFIAPEVFLKCFGGVSHKSDVYSYGMLVLDMVGCRQNANADPEQSSDQQYFPQWIYRQLEQTEVSANQVTLNEEDLQRKMIIVSLWCIQTNPSSRPAMTKVVEMLEGALEDLQVPTLSSLATPPISNATSSTPHMSSE